MIERRDLASIVSWFASVHDVALWAGPATEFPLTERFMERMLATQTSDGRACLTFAVQFDRAAAALEGTFAIAIDERTKHATLARVALAPAARGRGYAAVMARYAVQLAVEKAGARTIGLHVFTENEPAVAAYRACGFAFGEQSYAPVLIAGRRWHLATMTLDCERNSL